MQGIDGNLLTTCFSNILEKFTAKQAKIMGNFAEVLAENQSKNMNRISIEIGMQLNSFNENLSAYKANRSSGVATVSVNPSNKSVGAATISVNPARQTPQGPMPVERRLKIVTAVRVKLICKRLKESVCHLNVRKVNTCKRHS